MRVAAYRISLLFAGSVALATLGGVGLVSVLRPHTRRRPLPFYSDATHSEPERTLLSLCENFALALLPLVGCFERAQHERLFGAPLPTVVIINSWAQIGKYFP